MAVSQMFLIVVKNLLSSCLKEEPSLYAKIFC